METFRELNVFASTSVNAKYTITINGSEFKPNNKNEELFNFSTSTQFHGGTRISITVQEGELCLDRCLATYPATFNGIEGTLTMIQPMEEQGAIIEDGMIRSIPLEGIEISSGETFDYYHLLYNGPSMLIVEIDGHDVFPGVNIYIGDVLHKNIIDGIISIDEKIDYSDALPHDIWKKSDFEELKQFVLEKH